MTSQHACRICHNASGNNVIIAREMMLALGDEFEYLECGNCGCFQLLTIPHDFSRYYPEHYYSYKLTVDYKNNALKSFFKHKRAISYFEGKGLLGKLIIRISGVPISYPWLAKCHARFDFDILDVGCGNGALLCHLRGDGFKSLTGIDPLIEKDTTYSNGVRILKRQLSEMNDSFDIIMLHHSFEHMPDPVDAMHHLYRLLRNDRRLLIRLPLADSHARRYYGINWVQMDAPRHLFLHTKKSMELLAEMSGFEIEDIVYDSTEFQFWGSEHYKNGISLIDPRSKVLLKGGRALKSKEMKKYRKKASELNAKQEGDSACFYLYKQ